MYWLVQAICAEVCAKNLGISREEQDEYALQSYQRSQSANKRGVFRQEIVPVTVTEKKGTINAWFPSFRCHSAFAVFNIRTVYSVRVT